MMMRRCSFLLVAATVGWGLPARAAAPHSADGGATPPNIVFLFADDMCYEAIHALGCEEIETPNLDRLVREGLTFTHAYNQGSWTGAVCVASRTMLNTGRFLWHAQRIDKRARQQRDEVQYWSEHLRDAGYDTYFTGKWHVKADANKLFDYVKHVRPGMPNQTEAGYNRPLPGEPDVWKPWDRQFGGFWKGGQHWSEVLADDSIAFVRQAAQRDKPFFMYLAFNAPHDPRQSPRAYVERYPLADISVPLNFLPEYPFKDAIGCGRRLRDERLAPFPRTEHAIQVHRQEYYAIITHMDEQIGRILHALRETDQLDNTYLFFSADHGLAVGQHGLLGKQNLFDHSVRVPLMVVGPDLAAGRRIDSRVYLQDIMPSTLELAGVARPPAVQFRSLMPLARGSAAQSYDAVYGAYLDLHRMVTAGNHKLILYPKIGKILLYNLENDPHEMHNLADDPDNRATIKQLFTQLLNLQQKTGDTLDLKTAFPQLN